MLLSRCLIAALIAASFACAIPRREWMRTDNPERDAKEITGRILDAVGAAPGMTVADIGAGAGYFTFKLSALVGAAGRVIATDADSEMVDILRREKAARSADNVTVVPVEARDPLRVGVEPGSADAVLVVNLFLFTSDGHFADMFGDVRSAAYLRFAGLWRALVPGGRAVILNDQVRERDLPFDAVVSVAAELFEVIDQRRLDADPGRTPGYLLILRKPAKP